MNGTLKLGLMVIAAYLTIYAFSYAIAEIICKYDDWRN
jgi:hypothetical protein